MRAALATSLLLLVPLVLAGAAPAVPSGAAVVDLHVAGAHGLVGVPAGQPDTLVVILRGYGHTAESHRAHLQHLADQGYLAVAMDFAGPKEAFPLAVGAAETQAAIAHLKTAYPSVERSVLYSVSMGTAVAALLLPAMPGEFEYWVNNEGLTHLTETWAEAKSVCPGVPFGCTASAAIEAETGGTPATHADAYRQRSIALRAHEIVGVKGVVLTHGLNDGLVPYNQGREMVAALRAEGIPADFYTYARCHPGGEGTAITGYTPLGGMGLAGHGTESNDSHCLTALSFALLDDVLAGRLVPADRERVVDNGLGTLP